MKLTFLGTRGNIEAANRRHRRHSSLLVAYYGRSVMVDCGDDWSGDIESVGPDAIAVTHGHPDHAGGLRHGAPCPVLAPKRVRDGMPGTVDVERREMPPGRRVEIEGIGFEAFPVEHSLRAPAVGYRISAGRVAVFYVPDVVHIPDRAEAMGGCRLYIGDGATVTRSMIRKADDSPIGHVPVRTQLTWCADEGVPRAILTHCGSGIVAGDERVLGPKIDRLARERGVQARIAHDGMEVVLR